MELICPSCDARYQLPDGAIGEKGRNVSCMNCGHNWHAYPPLMLSAAERAPEQPAPAGIPFPGHGAQPAATGAPPPPPPSPLQRGVGDEEQGEPGTPKPGAGSRSEQLAEIREMLAEVQSEASETPPPAPTDSDPLVADSSNRARSSAFNTEAEPETPIGTRSSDLDEDELASRLQRNAEATQAAKPVDVDKLRRKHERRERAHKRNKKAGSGAFLTGFLLVAMIAALMIALYILHPAIIERMPGTEAALTEYVATIDGLRVSVAETFEQARDWVIERADKSENSE